MRKVAVVLVVTGLLAGAAVPVTGGAPPSLPPFDRGAFDATMTLEQVEPGVVQVLDDGAGHDLTDVETFEDLKPASLLAAGDDGSVWMTSSGGFIEIGTPGEVPDPLDTFLAQMEIGPDGTLWIADNHHGSSIGEWRDGAWTIHELPADAWVVWLEATPDGGLDFAWRDDMTLRFDRLSGTDHAEAPLPSPLQLGSPDGSVEVARTHDGRTWVAEGRSWLRASRPSRFEPGPLWVHDGTGWLGLEPLGELPVQPRGVTVDKSGLIRVSWWEVVPGKGKLVASHLTRREEDGSWSVFSEDRWIALSDIEDRLAGDRARGCEGYARFDGDELIRYLDGLCLRRPAITPTGEVWVFGHDRQRQNAGIYVILPEP